jgi:hypothetical protein
MEGSEDFLAQAPKGYAEILERDKMDEMMGFFRLTDGNRLGWLINMHEASRANLTICSLHKTDNGD